MKFKSGQRSFIKYESHVLKADILLTAEDIYVQKGDIQPVWVELQIPESLKTGEYSGTVEIYSHRGFEKECRTGEVTFRLTVKEDRYMGLCFKYGISQEIEVLGLVEVLPRQERNIRHELEETFMLWEELRAGEFGAACEKAKGTCVIPIGVIEKHGDHLPLGTDMYRARMLAEEIAKLEPVVIFPYYFFGQIAEAKHCPGTIAIRPDLMYSMLEEICQEISRNGFKKIVILSTHGGNPFFVRYFAQSTLYAQRDYAVYVMEPGYGEDEGLMDEVKKILGSDHMGAHAGNLETSEIMAIRPDLVRMEISDPEGAKRRGMLKHIIEKNIFTGINWYSNFPTHHAGDPSQAKAEAGEKVLNGIAKKLSKTIKAIKEDQETARLLGEFYSKCGLSE